LTRRVSPSVQRTSAKTAELTLEQAAEVLGISPQYFRRCHEALKLHPPFTLEKLAPYLEPRLTGTLPDDVKAKIASLMLPRKPGRRPGPSPSADPPECGAA
jgi:hypothetical protein